MTFIERPYWALGTVLRWLGSKTSNFGISVQHIGTRFRDRVKTGNWTEIPF